MAQTDVERIRQAYEAYNRDGLEGMLPYLDPEVEWHNPPNSPDRGVWHGHEGVRSWFRELSEPEFESVRFRPDEIVDLAGGALVLCTVTVRGRGTGIELEVPFAHLITIRDDLVTELRMFTDHAEARKAAGLG